ncbi:DUF6492 family protein [Polynucleobacter sp. AP-Nickl1-40-C4]|uniref:DUF6492 family protein n=1 Tax=Polynucleobacter sp. AP-Nickl1-40-C4 TaxID=3108275 RepID=UPI002B230670|nr:DUF6492 family protein [Polynucleobacter sp. AP-Nickl1-40-C4]MEA9568032.1 DUF6492 family protein [Polynucleobacter sp. AP-Nickl1-40-C4]
MPEVSSVMPAAVPAIDEVISVCSIKDIDVWTVAAKHIVQYISAKQYTVIVPDAQVEMFAAVTKAPYQVKPESQFVGSLKEKIAQTLTPENQDRVGWYLQQFVKISAVLTHDDQDIVLIWDADTVPLKKLEFINSSGQFIYYKGDEYRKSYFDFIERALGLKRTQNFSFIAQSLILKVSWARELTNALAQNAQLPWIEAVLSFLDKAEPAGFAEFETLGSWIWNHHSNEIVITDKAWYRNGLSLVGNPLALSKSIWMGLAKHYDFISFEGWDMKEGVRNGIRQAYRRVKLGLEGKLI